MGDALELQIHLRQGREVECARYLWAKVEGNHRAILVALAAELVALHEAAAAGSAVVVVTGADQAERVLRDLRRDQPAVSTPKV